MLRGNQNEKLTKDIEKFTKGGVTLGVGSAIGAGLAAKAPGASVTPAFSSAAGMMPMVGTTMMGVGTLRMVRKLNPKKRKRRKNETNPEDKQEA